MPVEPAVKRTIAFFDGQNIFHAARRVFGTVYPDYDPELLAEAICEQRGWCLRQVRFYTGIPTLGIDPFWHEFWKRKLAGPRRRGVYVFTRELHYRQESLALADGRHVMISVGREKGIDVRLALDIVGLAASDQYDVALIFSQDQDLSEAATEVRGISVRVGRWIKVACAFPWTTGARNQRGINGTEWVRIESGAYAAAVDRRDYRIEAKRKR